jgi:hypothetical protein
MSFVTPLELLALPARDEWALTRPLQWHSPGDLIIVPARFITDLASIPRPLRGLLDVCGPSRRAAVLHDWLYCLNAFRAPRRRGNGVSTWSRAQCDHMLYVALMAEGMPSAQARIYWLGVRLGGWVPWGTRARKGNGGLRAEDFVRL